MFSVCLLCAHCVQECSVVIVSLSGAGHGPCLIPLAGRPKEVPGLLGNMNDYLQVLSWTP